MTVQIESPLDRLVLEHKEMNEKDFQRLIYMFLDLWSVVNTVAWSLIIITVIVDQVKTPAISKF